MLVCFLTEELGNGSQLFKTRRYINNVNRNVAGYGHTARDTETTSLNNTKLSHMKRLLRLMLGIKS